MSACALQRSCVAGETPVFVFGDAANLIAGTRSRHMHPTLDAEWSIFKC